VWDLYGGIGDTAAALAARGADVVSVDADQRAVAWARRRSIHGRVRFIAARAEDAVARLPAAEAVVVNPPRTGLDRRVTRRLAATHVARLAYVSCDPATLARDLARLAPPYRVDAVRAFDLFPQTAHVETVVALRAA
jgi:23S rRNA (uracil1939-C5)-methyltransferase